MPPKGESAALRAQLAECKDKIERLQFDRTALHQRLRDVQDAGRKEVETVNAQIRELKAQYNKPPEAEKHLAALANAVLRLYIEVKDRTVLTETEELRAENSALAKTNSIVVVSYLRTLIRNTLCSKEDCERDLRAQLKLSEDEAAQTVRSLHERMASVQSTQTRAISMAEEARIKLEDAEFAKDAALDDSRNLIEQVKADQMALVQQMRAKGEEIEKLQKVIQDKDKQLKKQETKMLQMAGLESEVQSLRAENKLNFQKMQAQHEAKTAHFQKDLLLLTVFIQSHNPPVPARVTEPLAPLECVPELPRPRYRAVNVHTALPVMLITSATTPGRCAERTHARTHARARAHTHTPWRCAEDGGGKRARLRAHQTARGRAEKGQDLLHRDALPRRAGESGAA